MAATPRELHAYKIADSAERLVETIAVERSQARLDAVRWRDRFDRVMAVAERQQAQITGLRAEWLQQRATIDALAFRVETLSTQVEALVTRGPVAVPGRDGYFTAKQACEYLGITRRTLYRWVSIGKVKQRRTPDGIGKPRFTRADLDDAIQAVA